MWPTHIVLDFDGLILDTETPDFVSWRDEYEAHGVHLDSARWLECIGSTAWFDLYEELEVLVGAPIDHAEIRESRRARYRELIAHEAVLPGVRELLAAAAETSVPVAIASSSTTGWVQEHVERLGLDKYIETICGRDATGGVAKPDPAVYVEACRRLSASPSTTVAFEDTPNGISAARAAGLWTVYVPGAMTRHLDCEDAHLRCESVAEVRLDRLMGILDAPQ